MKNTRKPFRSPYILTLTAGLAIALPCCLPTARAADARKQPSPPSPAALHSELDPIVEEFREMWKTYVGSIDQRDRLLASGCIPNNTGAADKLPPDISSLVWQAIDKIGPPFTLYQLYPLMVCMNRTPFSNNFEVQLKPGTEAVITGNLQGFFERKFISKTLEFDVMFGGGSGSTDGQHQRERRSTNTSVTLFLGLQQPNGTSIHGGTAIYQIELVQDDRTKTWNLFVGGNGLSTSSHLKIARADLVSSLAAITMCAVIHTLGNTYMIPYYRIGDIFTPDAALDARVRQTFNGLQDDDLERNLKRFLVLSDRKLSLSGPGLNADDKLILNVELARRGLDLTAGPARHQSLVTMATDLWRTLDYKKGAAIVDAIVASHHTLPPAAEVPPPTENILLRAYGSTSIGDEFAPALARAFLKTNIGATETGCYQVQKPYKGEMVTMQHCWGKVPGNNPLQVVEILSAGSEKAFECLAEKSCDLGSASRPFSQEDRFHYPGLEDLTRRGSEHIISVDGTAVVVNEKTAALMPSLTVPQVRRIFCETSAPVDTWDELGVPGLGKIHRVIRNPGSGTREMFIKQVCGPGGKLREVASQDQLKSEELANFVAGNPTAMGFVSSTLTGRAVAVPIASAVGQPPVRPDNFSISEELYPLSRRLYIYNSSSVSPVADKFVRFALSGEGQEVAKENHFVPLLPQFIEGNRSNAMPAFRALVGNARRLSLSFRFESGSAELLPDRLAHDNIERLRSYLDRNPSVKLLVLGFADTRPLRSGASNQRLSELRAAAIAAELHDELGVPYSAMIVKGFGAAMPVDSNETETGQYRNRRVEIWAGTGRF